MIHSPLGSGRQRARTPPCFLDSACGGAACCRVSLRHLSGPGNRSLRLRGLSRLTPVAEVQVVVRYVDGRCCLCRLLGCAAFNLAQETEAGAHCGGEVRSNTVLCHLESGGVATPSCRRLRLSHGGEVLGPSPSELCDRRYLEVYEGEVFRPLLLVLRDRALGPWPSVPRGRH